MNPDKKNHFSTYKKMEVLTANRETILLMLYESCVVSLKSAIKAAESNNITERNRLTQKAQEIVSELRASLNFKLGSDIAENLDSLYLFVSKRILEGNLDNNIEFLKQALKTLETLHKAWSEAIESLKKERAQATGRKSPS